MRENGAVKGFANIATLMKNTDIRHRTTMCSRHSLLEYEELFAPRDGCIM